MPIREKSHTHYDLAIAVHFCQVLLSLFGLFGSYPLWICSHLQIKIQNRLQLHNLLKLLHGTRGIWGSFHHVIHCGQDGLLSRTPCYCLEYMRPVSYRGMLWSSEEVFNLLHADKRCRKTALWNCKLEFHNASVFIFWWFIKGSWYR